MLDGIPGMCSANGTRIQHHGNRVSSTHGDLEQVNPDTFQLGPPEERTNFRRNVEAMPQLSREESKITKKRRYPLPRKAGPCRRCNRPSLERSHHQPIIRRNAAHSTSWTMWKPTSARFSPSLHIRRCFPSSNKWIKPSSSSSRRCSHYDDTWRTK